MKYKKELRLLKKCVPELVRQAGEVAVKMQVEDKMGARFKSATGNEMADIVTAADHKVQEIILKGLLETDLRWSGILAEEESDLTDKFENRNGIRIAVDPIDGTHRYAHGSLAWEVIVTVYSSNDVLYSCVHAPRINYLVQIDDNDGITVEGKIPEFSVKTSDKLVKATRYKEAVERFPEVKEIIRENALELTDDVEMEELGGRVGTSTGFLSGSFSLLIYPLLLIDKFFPIHYAKYAGLRVIPFGPGREHDDPGEYLRSMDYHSGSIVEGGYVVGSWD